MASAEQIVMRLNPMPRSVAHAILVLVFGAVSGCVQVNSFNHSSALAGRKAQQFADAAFVERNLPAAYALLSQETRSQLSLDQFKDMVSNMHPSQYPSSVKATEYEPLFGGQDTMDIYLVGEGGDERFYYRFVMKGTKEADYMVRGFWRNDGPYPLSTMRKPLNQ